MSGRGTGRRAAAAILVAAWLGACARETPPGAAAAAAREPAPIERTAQRGPVTATARVDRDLVTVGDPIALTLEVLAEPHVAIVMPRPGATLGDFDVDEARTPPDLPDGGRRRWLHRYALSTFTPGALEIPALTVAFTEPPAPGADAIEGEISLGPFPIEVRSVLEARLDPAALLTLKDPVDVPVPRPSRWPAVALGALALAAAMGAVALVLRRRRRRIKAGPPPVPAHLRALEELRRLAADGLLERGEVHAYYFRLSDVVRRYLERRFGLSAPERTTEEFLREARRDPVLRDDHKDLLGGFLRAADMVKFARHVPPRSESEGALVAARSFVEQTAETGAPAPPAGREAAA